MRQIAVIISSVVAGAALALQAADPATSSPRPVPLTRPEMKQLLEDMKDRKPRFPLPELTAEEQEQLGERGGGYEGRLRMHYLADGQSGPVGFGGGGGRPAAGGNGTAGNAAGQRQGAGGRGDFRRNADENMTLDYQFKTMLFWIVSRTNNCQYCLGHQEHKLLATGMTDDEIAALDFDWLRYTPAQQAAFAYARKLTYEPHNIRDADIDALRMHYTDLQILEMTLSIAGNNSINRWKEGAGVPQSRGNMFARRNEGDTAAAARPAGPETYLTPTSEEFQTTVSKVAPLLIDEKTGKTTRLAVSRRPKLESRAAVEQALEAAAKRTARLPLVSEEEARKAFGEEAPEGTLTNWMRLLANFPKEGGSRLRSLRAAQEKGELSPLLKAQVSWIIARQDGAWYAVGEARQRLRELGQSDEQIYKLDGNWESFTPAEQALFTVARNLATTPVVMTDEDAHKAMEQTSAKEVVQLVSYVTGRAYFDRITEAAGLPLDPQ